LSLPSPAQTPGLDQREDTQHCKTKQSGEVDWMTSRLYGQACTGSQQW